MKYWHIIWFIQLFTVTVKCNNSEIAKHKKLLPYFRRVDEHFGDLETKGAYSDDLQSQLALFVGDNIKEIFSENDEFTKFSASPTHPTETVCIKNDINSFKKDSDDMKDYRNVSHNTLIDMDKQQPSVSSDYELKKAKQSHTLLFSENSLKKSEHKLAPNQNYLLLSSLVPKPSDELSPVSKNQRSCIYCDNVMTEDCSNPKNEIIPSVECERDGDQCYSLHTPFGVIDRGCYNVNRNLSIYVCACNLCNFISIAEMPYVFSNKREWAHNVVELSHSKKLRKSVFKDMACLKCEVNATKNSNNDIIDNENCLEGNVGHVPTEVCSENEICAVKVVKDEGYVWRGCVKSPLYNYWWTLCDRDLCNNDNLISIYDYL